MPWYSLDVMQVEEVDFMGFDGVGTGLLDTMQPLFPSLSLSLLLSDIGSPVHSLGSIAHLLHCQMLIEPGAR